MAWPFLYVQRRGFMDSDRWGTLYVKSDDGWEKLSYSYELPWREDARGRSMNKVSRIKEGVYELHVREGGSKGWRLELNGTGHRKNVQVHRAHKSMYIEGCILPVDFLDFRNEPVSGIGPIELLNKGDYKIEVRSIGLMDTIRARYTAARSTHNGPATILIAATLPASEPRASRSIVA